MNSHYELDPYMTDFASVFKACNIVVSSLALMRKMKQ